MGRCQSVAQGQLGACPSPDLPGGKGHSTSFGTRWLMRDCTCLISSLFLPVLASKGGLNAQMAAQGYPHLRPGAWLTCPDVRREISDPAQVSDYALKALRASRISYDDPCCC